jgi:hypothetical protein
MFTFTRQIVPTRELPECGFIELANNENLDLNQYGPQKWEVVITGVCGQDSPLSAINMLVDFQKELDAK